MFRNDMDKFNIINPTESPDVEKFTEKECDRPLSIGRPMTCHARRFGEAIQFHSTIEGFLMIPIAGSKR